MEQGREQGREEGKQDKQLEIAKKMLDENMDLSLISKMTGLTKEKIEKLM
jgi:predicted transposase/invertase (TIGR01784 family)